LTPESETGAALFPTAVYTPHYQGVKSMSRDNVAQCTEAYAALFPPYQLLIESYSKAQEVVTKHEALDSQRK
jgi:hypothetical protein